MDRGPESWIAQAPYWPSRSPSPTSNLCPGVGLYQKFPGWRTKLLDGSAEDLRHTQHTSTGCLTPSGKATVPLRAHPHAAWPADCWGWRATSPITGTQRPQAIQVPHGVGAQRLTRKSMCGVPGLRIECGSTPSLGILA